MGVQAGFQKTEIEEELFIYGKLREGFHYLEILPCVDISALANK